MIFVRRAVLLLLPMVVAACGEDPDNWDAGRPLIRRLTYLQQTPDKPFLLEFALEFEDSDGDLSGGKVHLFTNDQEQEPMELSAMFTSQGIDAGALLGELEVKVTIETELADGERVKVGFVLEDAAGNKSNDPSIVLQTIAPGG